MIAKRNKWVVGNNRRVEKEENQDNPQITQWPLRLCFDGLPQWCHRQRHRNYQARKNYASLERVLDTGGDTFGLAITRNGKYLVAAIQPEPEQGVTTLEGLEGPVEKRTALWWTHH